MEEEEEGNAKTGYTEGGADDLGAMAIEASLPAAVRSIGIILISPRGNPKDTSLATLRQYR